MNILFLQLFAKTTLALQAAIFLLLTPLEQMNVTKLSLYQIAKQTSKRQISMLSEKLGVNSAIPATI